ncbi:MAG: DHA2 family efflux MFS transporter permease subunit [Candidatus Korobacteraceae bacterium]
MKPPCDEAAIVARPATSPCPEAAGRWVLAATILASSMAYIDSTVVNVALPALQTSFSATVVDVQWVVESYGLTLAALILVGGSMGDLFGRRLIFLLGVGLFAIASMFCGLAANIQQLILARAVQGIGAAFLIPQSLALISASFAEKGRGRAIGTWSGSTAMTTAIGPVIGGWLIEHWSWRWAFFLNVPLAAAVIVIALWHVPESRSGGRERIDWWGALTATLSLAGLVYGFIESASFGWRNPLVLGSLGGGVVCLIAFVFIEAKSELPMVPLTLFRSQAFAGANLLTLFLYAATGIFFFLLPLDLIQVQGYSATAAGGAILPMILLMFLLSRWSGGLIDRYGPRLPLIVGPLIVAFGFLLFSIPSTGGSYWTTFFPAMVVLGSGMAVSVPPLTTVVMGSIAQDRAGTASGINNAVARVAALLAIAVLGVVMVTEFGAQLNRHLAVAAVPQNARGELQSNANKLAALRPPAGLDPATSAAIESSIVMSFLFGFRLIMWICAALALASATVTWRMIQASARPVVLSNSQNANFVATANRAQVQ